MERLVVVSVGQPLCEAVLADLVRVGDAMPVARRGGDGLLLLDGDGHLDHDFFLLGDLLDDLVVLLNGDVDGEVLLDDDGDSTLDHHLDGGGDVDGSHAVLLNGHFFESVDEGDGGHIIGLADSDDEGLFVGDCLDEFLGLHYGHVGVGEHGDLTGDRLNVVLGDFAFFAGDDDLGLGG